MCLDHTMCKIAVQFEHSIHGCFFFVQFIVYYQEKSIDLLCWCLFEVIPAERAESSWLCFFI